MVYIKTNEDDSINIVHHMPFDEKHGLKKSKEELLEVGYFVDKIPEIKHMDGKIATQFYSPQKGFWCEYRDKPLTQEDKIDKLQNDIDYLILKQEGLI